VDVQLKLAVDVPEVPEVPEEEEADFWGTVIINNPD
jgi:hypothetical protein